MANVGDILGILRGQGTLEGHRLPQGAGPSPAGAAGDPLYTEKFASILKTAGVDPVRLPPPSPNLNAHAECFVRSVKEECLDHLILFSEEQLRYVLAEYLKYYHQERIHQGINRIIEPQHEGNQGEIICIERPGGLLKSYHRKAA
ncbi:MAG: integrase core domain-containing protein [Sedimentisphaerales bacterium]|nr:integrase core domain-containing protein [Sedimentisphaerales bacterium]